jgi:hypothetical protein
MCETMYAGLTANVAVSGYVGDNTFNYYHFTAFSAVNMLITVTQTAGGDCDLYVFSAAVLPVAFLMRAACRYVKSSHNPTRTDYDYRDIGFNTNSSVTVRLLQTDIMCGLADEPSRFPTRRPRSGTLVSLVTAPAPTP